MSKTNEQLLNEMNEYKAKYEAEQIKTSELHIALDRAVTKNTTYCFKSQSSKAFSINNIEQISLFDNCVTSESENDKTVYKHLDIVKFTEKLNMLLIENTIA